MGWWSQAEFHLLGWSECKNQYNQFSRGRLQSAKSKSYRVRLISASCLLIPIAIFFQNFCRSDHVSSDQNPLDKGWNLPGLSGFFLNHYGNSYQLNHVKRRRWGFWIHHQPSIIYLYIPMHFDCPDLMWLMVQSPPFNPFLVLKHLQNPVGFCWLNPYSWLKKGCDHQKSPPKILKDWWRRLFSQK